MNRRQFAAAAIGTATGGALIKLHAPPTCLPAISVPGDHA